MSGVDIANYVYINDATMTAGQPWPLSLDVAWQNQYATPWRWLQWPVHLVEKSAPGYEQVSDATCATRRANIHHQKGKVYERSAFFISNSFSFTVFTLVRFFRTVHRLYTGGIRFHPLFSWMAFEGNAIVYIAGYSQLDPMEQNSVKSLVEIWTFSFQENAFENVWKIAAILSRPKVLNQLFLNYFPGVPLAIVRHRFR